MVTFLTGVAKNKSSTAGIGGNVDDGQHSKTKAPKTKKRVDPSDNGVAPTVPKRKKEEDLYKNFLEEKGQRESGWRLMRVGNKKQRGEVRGEEKVHEGKSDEKDSDSGKESQQIEMARTEKESREREVEIWQKKRKWEEEWRREELERREKERREWEEKWKKEELERRKKEKREWEEKWKKEELERRKKETREWEERERKEWEEGRRKEEVERRETEKREWEDERRRQDVERKEKERRELEEERRKEDVQHRESLQEDNTDVMVLPLDLDWPDWSLDSPTTSQTRSGWQSTSFKQSSENWQSQMNEVN